MYSAGAAVGHSAVGRTTKRSTVSQPRGITEADYVPHTRATTTKRGKELGGGEAMGTERKEMFIALHR